MVSWGHSDHLSETVRFPGQKMFVSHLRFLLHKLMDCELAIGTLKIEIFSKVVFQMDVVENVEVGCFKHVP